MIAPRLLQGGRPHLLLSGAALAALYLAVAAALFEASGRQPAPIFDGLAPPVAYRWVRPPAELLKTNLKPESGMGSFTLTPAGSVGAAVSTGDGQMSASFPEGAIPLNLDDTSVKVTITPMAAEDPPRMAAGWGPDGNAYRIKARYEPSGKAAALKKPITVVIRYPIDGRRLMILADGKWSPLAATIAVGTMTIFAESTRMGTLAAATPLPMPLPARATPGWAYLAASVALAAAVLLTLRRHSTPVAQKKPRPGPPARRRRRP